MLAIATQVGAIGVRAVRIMSCRHIDKVDAPNDPEKIGDIIGSVPI